MVRGPTEQVQIKIRLREWLRADLEAEAAKSGYPFSTEIVRRLQQSLHADATGGTVFGDPDTFAIVSEFAQVLRAIEMTAGRRWNEGTAVEGRDMLIEAFNAMVWLLQNAPALLAGQPLPVLRDMHARLGYEALRSMMGIRPRKRRREEQEAAAGRDQCL